MKGLSAIHATMRFWVVMFAALFLFAQASAQSHAAEFGIDHDHDGVACSVSVLGDDKAPLPAPLETEAPIVVEVPAPALRPTHLVAFTNTHPCRAPPPRGPPH